MIIDILCNHTFTSALPDDLRSVHQYGSEGMAAILATELSKEHEIHFYAPVGSSRIGVFHPIRRTDGKYIQPDTLDNTSLDGSKTTDLLQSDFIIDMTPFANTLEELTTYYDFRKYIAYRLGFRDYLAPKLPPNQCHFLTHCQTFADLYEKAGYPGCQVAHFGISDFWSLGNPPDWDPNYFSGFDSSGIHYKDYLLYPHRYNREKGSFLVLKLAQDFPKETFVFSSAAVLPDHIQQLNELKTEVVSKNLTNVKFVDFPSTPDREFYRRELYRNAKCTLSPFIANTGYHDTGGILSMESIKCGTPVIVTRSLGSEEILGHQEDKGVFFSDGYESLKLLVKYIDFLGVIPEPWKWTVENYKLEYEQAVNNIVE